MLDLLIMIEYTEKHKITAQVADRKARLSSMWLIIRACITTRQKLYGFAAVQLPACARENWLFSPVCATTLPCGIYCCQT
jgi:hypothetical protein